MAAMHDVEMTAAEDGQRLDRYLRKLLPGTPLGAIFKMLRRGIIRVDGTKAQESLRLVAGMHVTLPPSAIPRLSAQSPVAAQAPVATQVLGANAKPAATQSARSLSPALTPTIVHRDDDLLVVIKPAGLAVQPGSGQDHHVLSWLDAQPFGTRTATYRPAPVHRLDRGTSGLLVIGLSPIGSRALADAFREDLIQKSYVAVVEGVPNPAQATIDVPLWLRENARANQPKVLVDERGKNARTDYQVLESGRNRALLQLTLHTGRTHQIRAHLGHVGHPIVGDRRYGAAASQGDAFFLHASELTLPHPTSGKRLTFQSAIPARFREALHLR
ncbi:MAG: 23S rRNA pseudouridine955/2504/2580 synthase [Planctomycetota bacterium]|jgi:23S rRNA pseudouridine955/2504/2580 synthase